MNWRVENGRHCAETVMAPSTLPHTWKIEPAGIAFVMLLNGNPISKQRSIVQLKSTAESIAALLGHKDAT